MVSKHLICPERLRKVPRQFSWVDHRLVRGQYIEQCSHHAAALYLFLVTVGDSQGLSYYADASIMTRLSMDSATLQDARGNLAKIGLIAWEAPLYQVLSLGRTESVSQRRQKVESGAPRQSGQPTSLGDILNQAMRRAHDQL